jgi:hypothetical protein
MPKMPYPTRHMWHEWRVRTDTMLCNTLLADYVVAAGDYHHMEQVRAAFGRTQAHSRVRIQGRKTDKGPMYYAYTGCWAWKLR